MSTNLSPIDTWQAVYEWACRQPEDEKMDSDWWWNASVKHQIAKELNISKPKPENAWIGDLLDKLYGALFDGKGITVGEFKALLEQVKPPQQESDLCTSVGSLPQLPLPGCSPPLRRVSYPQSRQRPRWRHAHCTYRSASGPSAPRRHRCA